MQQLLVISLSLLLLSSFVKASCELSISDLDNRVLTPVTASFCEKIHCFAGNTTLTVNYDNNRIISFTFKAQHPDTSPLDQLVIYTPKNQNLLEVTSDFYVSRSNIITYNFLKSCTTKTVNGNTKQSIDIQAFLGYDDSYQIFSFAIGSSSVLYFSFLGLLSYFIALF